LKPEERDKRIYEMHTQEHRTLTAIGKHFGLTKERVRQIVNKHRDDVQDIRTPRNG